MAEDYKALDATDQTQILVAVTDWINNLNILDGTLYPEFQNGDFGYCIKSDGGAILEEDILDNFTAEVLFSIYFTSNAVPDNQGDVFKPLNDLSAWFKKNGTAGLDIGVRRTPDELTTLKGATDLTGPNEDGNVTFFAQYSLTYDEEMEE